ncbi:MAG: 6-phosphogluconate dehydrogenase [Parcubacteria group bacterium Gr01-1014_30]|nr:MAG: 6-phosphogluconate dehydrogenase [Parcubacteria group bacterium Gr01-1014_30]
MKKQIAFIGLGKMGFGMVERLLQKGWEVAAFDLAKEAVQKVREIGAEGAESLKEVAGFFEPPRLFWIMVPSFAKATAGRPSGKPVDDILEGIAPFLEKGDIVIDGGNSYFKDSQRRAKELAQKEVFYLDVGVSGGPVSIREGKFAIMVGGKKEAYDKTGPVFEALSDTPSGYIGESGAGHFVKMIHNGIEYGMMQALAEGFTLLKEAPLEIGVQDAAKVYNQNSIITSRLTKWLQEGFEKYGEELPEASGSVAHTGEGEWTVKTAKEMKIPVPVIEAAFRFRVESQKKPSYTGKILSMLRAVFGGHSMK